MFRSRLKFHLFLQTMTNFYARLTRNRERLVFMSLYIQFLLYICMVFIAMACSALCFADYLLYNRMDSMISWSMITMYHSHHRQVTIIWTLEFWQHMLHSPCLMRQCSGWSCASPFSSALFIVNPKFGLVRFVLQPCQHDNGDIDSQSQI